MTCKLKRLIHEKHRAYKSNNKNKVKDLTKQIKHVSRTAKRNYENKLAKEKKPNPKPFYNYLKSKTKNKETNNIKNTANALQWSP